MLKWFWQRKEAERECIPYIHAMSCEHDYLKVFKFNDFVVHSLSTVLRGMKRQAKRTGSTMTEAESAHSGRYVSNPVAVKTSIYCSVLNHIPVQSLISLWH
jgi:hypothetical protein